MGAVMSKLSKAQVRLHAEAVERLKKDVLNDEDREFIYTHWHPGTVSNTAAASAFFTPVGLAFDFEFDAPTQGRILDACAGTGVLSWAVNTRAQYNNPNNLKVVTISAGCISALCMFSEREIEPYKFYYYLRVLAK